MDSEKSKPGEPRISPEMLARLVGGQLEIQNPNEEYLYRGEIQSIAFEGNELVVHCLWLAKGEGYPPIPKRWVEDTQLDYRVSLEIYVVNEQNTPSGSRVIMQSPITGEIAVLFPKDYERKLNRDTVEKP